MIVKSNSIKNYQDMYSHEKWCFIFQYGLLIIALMLILVGLHRNKQVIDNYRQNGIYVQGEVVFKTSKGVGDSYICL